MTLFFLKDCQLPLKTGRMPLLSPARHAGGRCGCSTLGALWALDWRRHSTYNAHHSQVGLSEMGGGGNAGASTLGAHRPSTGAMRGVAAGAAAKKTCVPS